MNVLKRELDPFVVWNFDSANTHAFDAEATNLCKIDETHEFLSSTQNLKCGVEVKFTLLGFLSGKERLLERGLGFLPLQITESEGARGIASVCAIFENTACD